MNFYLMDFKNHGDKRGILTVFEKGVNLPFDLKRIFYSSNMPFAARRGCHANKDSEIVLVSVSGRCKVMVDDGYKRQEFVLDSPFKGLYCGKMTWKEMYDFSADNVLLALASEKYNDNEYIRDYDIFLKKKKKIK